MLTSMESGWDYTVDEYLRIERDSGGLKHEYFDGQIRLMAGGTLEHGGLATAFSGQLYQQLRGGPCAAYPSDVRVRVLATGLITYPDLSVICGPASMDAEDALAHTNPTLLVEVTSRSSERYDHGAKWQHYQQIESLREYVIVSHRVRALHVFTRGSDGAWQSPVRYLAGERARLHSIGCQIDIDELYASPQRS